MNSDQHAFHHQLQEELGALRAFARTLARDASHADDLTQEALMKAWASRDRYEQGTNLRAWLFTILRNTFYSEFRKLRREVADTEGEHARRVARKPSQDHVMAMRDFQAALAQLPIDQREALVLIGAAGLSYEEASEICGVAVGTVKSRVSRARARLQELLDVTGGGDLLSDHRMDAALGGSVTNTAA
jgi:RNA polymerase sigma-70 factor (ECF subfamily)